MPWTVAASTIEPACAIRVTSNTWDFQRDAKATSCDMRTRSAPRLTLVVRRRPGRDQAAHRARRRARRATPADRAAPTDGPSDTQRMQHATRVCSHRRVASFGWGVRRPWPALYDRREPDREHICSPPLIRPRPHVPINARGGVGSCSIKVQNRSSSWPSP
jgi:hypothetical protein